jgi:RNA polymerase sigma factor (sigma-70 family)
MKEQKNSIYRTKEEKLLWSSYFYSRTQENELKLFDSYKSILDIFFVRYGKSLNGSRKDFEDYLGMGLSDSIKKFNPEKGVKFNTYAMSKITGKALDFFRAQDEVSRLTRERSNQYEDAICSLQQRLKREPTSEEIKEHLNLDSLVEENIRKRGRPTIPIENWERELVKRSYNVYRVSADTLGKRIKRDENKYLSKHKINKILLELGYIKDIEKKDKKKEDLINSHLGDNKKAISSKEFDRIEEAYYHSKSIGSYESLDSRDEDERSSTPFLSLLERISNPDQIDILEVLSNFSKRKKIIRLLKPLSDLEKLTLTLTYLDDMSFVEIAKLTGYDKSNISRIHTKAIGKLREVIKKYELRIEDYL